ncbi:MAG: hypothetical protein FWG42_08465 [Clostridiales bacterium]|nr:hypothetical protein [Clostridiales bacterium]
MIFLKRKRILSKALVALLLLLLALPLATVAAAVISGGAVKQEMVYVNLNADGTVGKIYVVNVFDIAEGGRIVDFGDYAALRNMTTNDDILYENQTVTIDSKAGKLYYEGELNSNVIPWDLRIQYLLNGVEYEARELAGKNGALEIEMSVRQNLSCNSVFFDNYALQAVFTFDTNRCTDIISESAATANVGRKRQLTYTILPGRETDIVIKANVIDFEMDAIAINGLPLSLDIDIDLDSNPDLQKEIEDLQDAAIQMDDGAGELADGIAALLAGVKELDEGAADLMSGAGELADSSSELDAGAKDLHSGVLEMKDGTADLVSGASELSSNINGKLYDGAKEFDKAVKKAVDGAQEIADSANELVEGAVTLSNGSSDLHQGLKELTLENDSLIAGAYSVFTQLTKQAEAQLNLSLAEFGMPSVALTPENYSAVITWLLNELSGGAYSEALAMVEAGIRAEITEMAMVQVEAFIRADSAYMGEINVYVEAVYGTEIQTAAVYYVAFELAQLLSPDNPEGFLSTPAGQAAVAEYLATLDGMTKLAAVRETIKVQYVDTVVASKTAEIVASPEKQQEIDYLVAAQLASDDVQSLIISIVNTMLGGDASYQGILALKKGLDDYNLFYRGLKEYTSNVDNAAYGASALSRGIDSLYSGADKLGEGAETLYDGLVVLKKGSEELLDGVKELRDGSAELLDGAIGLHNGVVELYDGVLKLGDGTVALLEGVAELQDGTITLSNGTHDLSDGIAELLEGASRLRDGTKEFRSKAAGMNDTLKDKIKAAIDDLLRGDFNPISFVSGRNTNVDYVQFVMKTSAVEKQVPSVQEPVQPEKLNLWQKLLRLFGLH